MEFILKNRIILHTLTSLPDASWPVNPDPCNLRLSLPRRPPRRPSGTILHWVVAALLVYYPVTPHSLSRAVSSAGRAPPLQGGGHRFEPCTAHQNNLLFCNRLGLSVCSATSAITAYVSKMFPFACHFGPLGGSNIHKLAFLPTLGKNHNRRCHGDPHHQQTGGLAPKLEW